MPPRVKSLWGNIKVEIHYVKTLPLKKVVIIILIISSVLLSPLYNIVLQGRSLVEVVNGASNTFFKVSTIEVFNPHQHTLPSGGVS